LLSLAAVSTAAAQDFDPNAAWPLCGRISDNPPAGWIETDGCPADRFGDPAHSDEPLSATFGPRPLASEANRYDFHRGVDIATPIGTPFFAIADGTVEIAGEHPSYSDPLIKLRHFRPGEAGCSPSGCYHSYYLHIGDWVVAETDTVVKGQLLGYTGASDSGFEHLHFEVRDAPPFDVFSAWQRDSIHPLSVLAYDAPNVTTITFNTVDFTDPDAGRADLTLVSNRFDLISVDLALYDAAHLPVAQPGDTPDAYGYLVEPSSWHMEDWNFLYTHKDSTAYPWSSFGPGGPNECPYHTDHGASYDAGLHMDAQQPGNPLEGMFNGVHIRTQKYWPSDVDNYEVDLDFQALTGPAACIEATATFASGETAEGEWGNCAAASGAVVTRGPYLQMQSDDGIVVRWRTDLATDSVVRYGAAPGSLDQSVTVAGSRTEHEVMLAGLGAATTWYYSVGESGGPIAGDASYFFSTAPVQGLSADTRIWVLGDSGTANSDARAVRDAYKAWAASDPADLMLMLGDNAYNDGTDAEYQAAVFDTYPEILRQLPLFSTLGNHDGHTADSATQSGPYYDILSLPAAGEIGGLASGTEAYYSFDYANIHFVCLDSYETDRSPGGTMMTWLESDLALNTQPWVVAFWHHPPYTKGSHDSDTEGRLIDMREEALPILEDWGVDLMLSGHSHSYERSYLLDGHYGHSTTLDPVNNVLDPGDGRDGSDGAYDKPDMVAAPHWGAVYAVAGSSGKVSGGSLDHPAMFVSLASLGSLILDVSGNRMDVTFLDEAGTVRDTFAIVKTPDGEPPLLTGASAPDDTHVVVDFNEALDELEAVDSTNYTIAGLTISGADLLPGDRSVQLTTSPMTSGSTYTLQVSNVQDLALNTILPGSEVDFEYFEVVTLAFQDGIAPDPAYAGTRDSYLREASPATNYGGAATLQVDGSEPSGSSTDMNIVVSWDVSDIPPAVTVEAASMTLNVTNISSGSYSCFELLSPWDEASVTWGDAAAGTPWSGPGASGVDRGTDAVCLVSASATGPLIVDFTTDGLAMVQRWVDDPAGNHGLVITDPDNGDGADFHSRDSGTAMARPQLEVTYRVPVAPPNEVPVAAFSYSCADLDCAFTDGSSDSDGSVVAWNWDFGDGNGATAQNPGHTYATAGTRTVTLTVTDDDGATGVASQSVTVTEPPPSEVDYLAVADLPGAGSVAGSYVDTHSDGGATQAIQERQSGGKKSDRYSFLEHTWQFTVGAATTQTVIANAWSGGSADGDEFLFEWSSGGNPYQPLFTVSSTSAANVQSALISATGTVYIRVADTDRTPGHQGLDSVIVDQLIIRADETVPTDPPGVPLNLQVTGATSSSLTLSWEHDGDNEQGFDLQRSPAGAGTWTGLPGPAAASTGYTDTGLDADTGYDYRIRAWNAAGASAWSNIATGATTVAPAITLTASGYRVKGKHVVDLEWSGATSPAVDIVRDGDVKATVPATPAAYTDNIGTNGGATYIYRVCESGTATCSDDQAVVF
jgi:PKD repeat protein/murein DD-endopeptidase MepM/ murein hydrolase activator NlpD